MDVQLLSDTQSYGRPLEKTGCICQESRSNPLDLKEERLMDLQNKGTSSFVRLTQKNDSQILMPSNAGRCHLLVHWTSMHSSASRIEYFSLDVTGGLWQHLLNVLIWELLVSLQNLPSLWNYRRACCYEHAAAFYFVHEWDTKSYKGIKLSSWRTAVHLVHPLSYFILSSFSYSAICFGHHVTH